MVDLGGYYHFKSRPGQQFLFCYGHSVAGQTETYAYAGMYWTWGKDKDQSARERLVLRPAHGPDRAEVTACQAR